MVVVINSDILLYDDFIDALEYVNTQFDRYLMIGARYDHPKVQPLPSLKELSQEWLDGFKAEALESGALHSYGGTDYYAWRPGGDPSLAMIGGRIPSFTYGRGKADNWIVQMAIHNGVVQVVDASSSVVAVHPAHDYSMVVEGEVPEVKEDEDKKAPPSPEAPAQEAENKEEEETKEQKKVTEKKSSSKKSKASSKKSSLAAEGAKESEVQKVERKIRTQENRQLKEAKYVNYWSANSQGQVLSDLNKHLAYTFGSYTNQQGTPLHAPWNLMQCDDARTGSRFLCLRKRVRPALCGCDHAAYTNKTLTDPELHEHYWVCGRLSSKVTETFPVSCDD